MIPNYSPYGQNDKESPYKGMTSKCPKCGGVMEDRFRGYAATMPTYEFWWCGRCNIEKPKYVVPPPKPSGIVLLPSSPPVENIPKSVEPDESKHFDPKKSRKR